MKGIGLVPNWQKKNTVQVVNKIRHFFQRRDLVLLVAGSEQDHCLAEAALAEELKSWLGQVELIIVVGGDGTILRAARELAHWNIPLLGINVGHTGFLAEIEVEQIDRYLQLLVAGQYILRERMMLQAVVRRESLELSRYLALNDIIISRGPFSRIIKLDAYINKEFLESYSGDGLIVSSPTGSTGYSLSAGGPVVNPYMELLVITPICPHSFYNRSIIVNGAECIQVKVGSGQTQVVLTADGQVGFALEKDDSVDVCRAEQKIRLVHFADSSFYRLLHQKLKG